MIQDKSIGWGALQIKFRPANLAEKDVQKAASLISPSFTNLPDSFIALGLDGPQVFAAVPTKPKAKLFTVATQGIGIPEALKQVLEKTANFLNGRV